MLYVQEFCQDTPFLSWKLLRVLAKLALWDRMLRWWSREFTPFLCLIPLPCPFSSPKVPLGRPPLFTLQKKAKQGSTGEADKSLRLSFDAWSDQGENLILLAVYAFLPQYELLFFFFQNFMLVWGLACFPLVVQCVSVVELLFTAQQAPQSAHTVSSHMALFDKGHKHF